MGRLLDDKKPYLHHQALTVAVNGSQSAHNLVTSGEVRGPILFNSNLAECTEHSINLQTTPDLKM